MRLLFDKIMIQHYIVRYDDHKDQYCVLEVLECELKLHSMYNTLAGARSNADKLNEQYQKSLAS